MIHTQTPLHAPGRLTQMLIIATIQKSGHVLLSPPFQCQLCVLFLHSHLPFHPMDTQAQQASQNHLCPPFTPKSSAAHATPQKLFIYLFNVFSCNVPSLTKASIEPLCTLYPDNQPHMRTCICSRASCALATAAHTHPRSSHIWISSCAASC